MATCRWYVRVIYELCVERGLVVVGETECMGYYRAMG